MAAKKKCVVYLGQDFAYLKNLKDRMTTSYEDTEFDFKEFFVESPEEVHLLVLDVMGVKADFIFIDYATFPEEMLQLASMFRRQAMFENIAVVGLQDYLADYHFFRRSIIAGVKINHIKSGEIQDVVFDAYMLGFPGEAKKPSWAEGDVNDRFKASFASRLGYITPDYMHIETNCEYKEGDVIEMKTCLGFDLGTQKFTVTRVIEENMYYHFEHSYDLNYEFSEDESEAKKKMKKLKEWISYANDMSKPKRTRILIIDRYLSFFEQITEAISNYPFSIRFHEALDDKIPRILKRTKAGIIAIEYEAKPPVAKLKEGEEKKSDIIEEEKEPPTIQDTITKLVENINEIEGYTPFIMLYNASIKSEELQKVANYPKIMVDNSHIEFKKIANVAISYGDKKARKLTHSPDRSFAAKEQRVYFAKSSERSHLIQFIEVLILKMSETAITFDSDMKIPDYTPIEFTHPVRFYATVIPPAGGESTAATSDLKYNYYALVNAIGEEDKKTLRQFINTLFFKEKNAAKKKDLEEFDALGVKYVDDKKKAEEEASKLKAEEAKLKRKGRSGSGDSKKSKAPTPTEAAAPKEEDKSTEDKK